MVVEGSREGEWVGEREREKDRQTVTERDGGGVEGALWRQRERSG